MGLAVSSTGDATRMVGIGCYNDNINKFPYVSRRTTVATHTETPWTTTFQPQAVFSHGDSRWVAIEYDGTNLKSYASLDGYAWWHVGTEPASFFTGTPDQVGFYGAALSSDNGLHYTFCPHFRVTYDLTEKLGFNR